MILRNTLVLSLITSALLAGSIASPTPIENGVNYGLSEDNTKNYITFTVSEDANVFFTADKDGIAVSFYDEDYNDYGSSNCNNYKIGNGFNCNFKAGTYIVNVKFYSYASTFNVFSTKMSDYVAPECVSNKGTLTWADGTEYVGEFLNGEILDNQSLTQEYINSLSNGWNLVGTSETIDTSIFGDATIWGFENYSWIENPSQIKPLQGFWIKK